MTKKLPCVVVSLGVSERNTPDSPPSRKLKAQPRQKSIGAVNEIRALQRVPMTQRKMNPVGSEMISVESM